MELVFTNPPFLWGLLGAGVPLLIHLLYRRRLRHVRFSSLILFRLMDIRAAHRRKWKRLLLMLLRMLLLAALALALSRPMLKGVFAGRGQSALAIVIDTSYSTALRSAGTAPLERSLGAAKELVSRYARSDRIQVVTTDDDAVEIATSPGLHSAGALRKISEIAPSPAGRPLDRAIGNALAWLAGMNTPRREIVIFSDFQKRAVTDEKIFRPPGAARIDYVLVNTGVSSPEPNLAIISARAATPAPGDRIVPIRVRVKNFDSQAQLATVHLDIEGAAPVEAVLNIPAGQAAATVLEAEIPSSGWRSGAVSITPDALTFDNRRFFAFRVTERPKVLVITARPHRNAYSDPSLYLRLALNPNPGLMLPGTLDVQTASADALDETEFHNMAMIFIVDAEALPEPHVERLKSYVAGGGTVTVFAGGHMRHEFWGRASGRWLIPGRLVEIQTSDVGWKFGRTAPHHPVLAEMADAGAPAIDFGTARFFERAAVEIPPDGAETTLLRFDDRKPAMLLGQFGCGRIVLFASGAHLSSNTFAPNPLFVVLWHSLIRNLSGDATSLRTVLPRAAAKIRVAGTNAITLLDGDKKIDLQKTADADDLWDVPPLAEPGVYWLAGADGFREPLIVNVDPDESAQEFYTDREIEKMLDADGRTRYYVAKDKNIVSSLTALKSGFDMTLWLLLLALLAFVAETFVGNRF